MAGRSRQSNCERQVSALFFWNNPFTQHKIKTKPKTKYFKGENPAIQKIQFLNEKSREFFIPAFIFPYFFVAVNSCDKFF